MELYNNPHKDVIDIACYGRNETSGHSGTIIKDFAVTMEKGNRLILKTNDELPIVFYSLKPKLIGGLIVDEEKSLKETTFQKIKEVLTSFNIKPSDLYVVFGPSLTFSHCPVERSVIEKLLDYDYRAAAKRTNGVDFIDIPVLNILQLRRLGIPFKNIATTNIDTYECSEILFSKLRGEDQKNSLEIEIIA